MSLALPRAGWSLPDWTLLAVGVPISAALAGAMWVAEHLQSDETLHEVALFAHLASLVVGFGAVLTIDWVGLLWILQLRSLSDVLDTAGNAQAPIWIGLTGLIVSGVLLDPDLGRELTQVKLGLVLLVTWNGLLAGFLHRKLTAREPGRLLLAISGLSAIVSQGGWWGAMLIGFLNH